MFLENTQKTIKSYGQINFQTWYWIYINFCLLLINVSLISITACRRYGNSFLIFSPRWCKSDSYVMFSSSVVWYDKDRFAKIPWFEALWTVVNVNCLVIFFFCVYKWSLFTIFYNIMLLAFVWDCCWETLNFLKNYW